MAQQLKRQLGVGGALLLGLGSMLGTGVFVSLAVAAGITGPAVVFAVAIAAGVAAANAPSSAQLAAAHPVSGGTYEYGYTFLRPILGFAAGWMFLVAKSASAATAALGVSGYVLTAVAPDRLAWTAWLAPAIVVTLTLIVLAGIRRTTVVNSVIVGITVLALAFFVTSSIPAFNPERFRPLLVPEAGRTPLPAFLYATALSFVAYTGYGRIATLGEEVRDPRRTIPRAIGTTVIVTFVLYVAVVIAGIGVLGSGGLARAVTESGAPLEVAAGVTTGAAGRVVLTVGAVTALLGVLLNLLLGLSRVLLAMARRRDMPALFDKLDRTVNPRNAVIAVGVFIALITIVGSVRLTWSFSAVTVLIYYAITNLSALALPPEKRLFPRWISILGLIGCLGLAAFVDASVVAVAAGVLAVGLGWFSVARARRAA